MKAYPNLEHGISLLFLYVRDEDTLNCGLGMRMWQPRRSGAIQQCYINPTFPCSFSSSVVFYLYRLSFAIFVLS